MTKRQKARRHERRQGHVEHQNAKRKEAIDNAVVRTGLHSDQKMWDVMEEQGYMPTRKGWQKRPTVRRRQPRKPA
jgi:hypothetical protein